MNAGGVLASMNFPSFPGFAARLFATEDSDFSLALVRAYNDWHIDEWCGAYPGRFIPMALPAIWDAELCAAEVRRCSKKGVHSLTFSENPAALGYPSFHDPYWNPLWEALVDTDTVLSVHIGSSGRLSIPAVDSPPDVMITLQPMNIVQAAADLLWSRPVKNYPDLKIALSEGGTGWIPYFLDRVDRTFEMHATWTLQDFGGKLPSEVFREHFLTCFISDPVGVNLRHAIGIDNIAWEMDYPHSDSMWPGAPEELGAVLADEQGARPRDQQDDVRKCVPLHAHPAGERHGGGAAQGSRRARHQHPGAQSPHPRRRRETRQLSGSARRNEFSGHVGRRRARRQQGTWLSRTLAGCEILNQGSVVPPVSWWWRERVVRRVPLACSGTASVTRRWSAVRRRGVGRRCRRAIWATTGPARTG
jgi:hypothetical protein